MSGTPHRWWVLLQSVRSYVTMVSDRSVRQQESRTVDHEIDQDLILILITAQRPRWVETAVRGERPGRPRRREGTPWPVRAR
jgi:hypothetical protein